MEFSRLQRRPDSDSEMSPLLAHMSQDGCARAGHPGIADLNWLRSASRESKQRTPRPEVFVQDTKDDWLKRPAFTESGRISGRKF